MSILKVANIHFEAAGTKRIDYLNDDVLRISFGETVLSGNARFNGNGATKLSVGTTAQRPTGESGLIRFNTQVGSFEGHNGTAWANIVSGIIDLTPANNYSREVGAAANGWANTISATRTNAANGWANTVASASADAANTLSLTRASAANGWANTISSKLFEDTVNATRYVIFDDATSGNFTQANVSPSGLQFNPSTRTLTSNNISVVQALGVGTAPSATTGEIRATNNITAYYSDKRLKTNIQKIINALEKIQNINGVTFQPNEVAEKYGYTNKKVQVGVIAQEVEAVLPQVVVPAPFDIGQNPDGTEYSISGEDYKTVQYEKLIPLLIEAIKELKAEIDLLKGKE